MRVGLLTSGARAADGFRFHRVEATSVAKPQQEVPARSASCVAFAPLIALDQGQRMGKESVSLQPYYRQHARHVRTHCSGTSDITSISTEIAPEAALSGAATTSAPPEITAAMAAGTAPSAASTSSLTPSVDAVFTTRYGTRWQVRPYNNSDNAAIVKLQTDSFHTPNPVPFLDKLTYTNFRAEVVDGLRQKTRVSDPSTFQLLVAEEAPPQYDYTATSGREGNDVGNQVAVATNGGVGNIVAAPGHSNRPVDVVGAVELTMMHDIGVLRELPRGGGEEYAYLSSMCVREGLRRRGVAQAMLAAAAAQARLWRQTDLALHVYKDNEPAVKLYEAWGMRVIAEDPGWKALLGGRVRLLMYKRLALEAEAGQEVTGGPNGAQQQQPQAQATT